MEELEQYKRNLRHLKEQAAQYGSTPPLDLINKIEFHERKIHELEEAKPSQQRSDPSGATPRSKSISNRDLAWWATILALLVGVGAWLLPNPLGVREQPSAFDSSSTVSTPASGNSNNVPVASPSSGTLTAPTAEPTIPAPTAEPTSLEARPILSPTPPSASDAQSLLLERPAEGTLAKDQILSYDLAGSANTPLLLDVQTKNGEGTSENFSVRISILDSKKAELVTRDVCCSNSLRVPFTPPADGQYVVTLTALASYGDYTIILSRP